LDCAVSLALLMNGEHDAETRELRQQLREQADRLRLALRAASMGTWEHVPSTHATFWDARSKEIFGLPPDQELSFEGYVAAVHPADLPGVFAGIDKALDPAGSGECSLQYRIKGEAAGEAWRWVEAHGHCTFLDGVPQRINGTLLDITDRKLAEEAIRDAARRKDEFLAVLGHELRNPLAPIRTALDLMQERYPEHAQREREVIDRQLKHMLRLVDDLLDLARVTRGSLTLKRETSELGPAIQRAVEIASPLFEAKQHQLALDIPQGLRVSVDVVRFSQIVANLLNNAAKFTAAGGRVRVRAERQGSHVSIEISDDGAGIESNLLERIFEPFIQGPRGHGSSQAGLGLGLSLVRDLVGLHGGSVRAYSEGLGRGSRFVVRLPLASGELESASVPARVSLPPAQAKRVLLVDDNQDAIEMMELLLTDRGYLVRSASDGMQALAVAAEFEPDVAVLDLGLPIMDGYELASRLLELFAPRGLRLIAVTGYGQAEDRIRTRAAGFALHLVKPVDLNELEAALSQP
jgi:signal transduction histidine kinase